MTRSLDNVKKLRETLSARADFGIIGDGTDETVKIMAAVEAARSQGKALIFSKPDVKYVYNTPIMLSTGMSIIGEGGPPNRWRSNVKNVYFEYTGAGAAIFIKPGLGQYADSIRISNIEINGVNSQAGCVGLYMDNTTGDFIEGIQVDNCTFFNFPINQIRHEGTCFDVTFRRVQVGNPDRTAENSVFIAGGQPSQITFDDCYLLAHTAGQWCVFIVNCDDARFINGTIAPYNGGAGANGVVAAGGLFIYGTHVEGVYNTQTTTVGIQYIGSNGAFISPALCALFGTGVKIGDGTSAVARGWTIAGNIGNNNIAAGGTADIYITGNGSRVGTILSAGFANSNPTIVNERLTANGVDEVTMQHLGYYKGRVIASDGNPTTPSLSVGSIGGMYNTGSSVGIAVSGIQQLDVRDTDIRTLKKIYPGTPAGAFQADAGMYAGTGIPSNALGGNGDFYLRADGGAATSIYHKEGGVWVGRA